MALFYLETNKLQKEFTTRKCVVSLAVRAMKDFKDNASSVVTQINVSNAIKTAIRDDNAKITGVYRLIHPRSHDVYSTLDSNITGITVTLRV